MRTATVVIGAVVSLLFALVFVAIGSSCGCTTSPPETFSAKVVGKTLTPAHYNVTMIVGAKGVVTPLITHEPDRFYVNVSRGGDVIVVPCNSHEYESAHDGDTANVRLGRFFGVKKYELISWEK